MTIMNAYAWTFAGLFGVTLILYIIAQARRIPLMEKTSRCLFIPFVIGLIASMLTEFLPDSYHILLIFTIAAGLEAFSLVCSINYSKRVFKFFELFLFLASCAVWTTLLFPVYKIYKIKEFVFIIIGAVFFAGFVTICFFTKKQKPVKYAAVLFIYCITAFLCATAFISMIYEKRLFAIIMFIGSLCAMGRSVFQIFQITKVFSITIRAEKTITTIVSVLAQILLGVGAILLQI